MASSHPTRGRCFPGQIVIFGAVPEALNLVRERYSLGTRRRIEITAFRRATIVFRPQAGNVAGSGPPVQTERSRPVGIDSTPVSGVDTAEAQPMMVADSSELTLMIDSLVKNDGDVTSAATQLGLSRNDFLSKLCGIGLSIE